MEKSMKRLQVGQLIGFSLIVLGGMLFLEKLGILRGAFGLFWGALFLGGSAYLLRQYSNDPQTRWWMILPGMVLLGMGAGALLPDNLKSLSGALIFAPIAIAFWIIYQNNHTHWWAIIPAGVLLTLSIVGLLSQVSGMASGGVFFLGLGLTFLFVARLPNPQVNTQWANIPGFILLTIGAVLSFGAFLGLATYFWPLMLIVVGGVLVFLYFFKR